jgi:hypothetical protein
MFEDEPRMDPPTARQDFGELSRVATSEREYCKGRGGILFGGARLPYGLKGIAEPLGDRDILILLGRNAAEPFSSVWLSSRRLGNL